METTSIDAKMFLLITTGTVVLVQIMKKGAKLPFLKWVPGNEAFVASLLPILFTITAKLAGMFVATDWVTALMWALGAAGSANVAHDKIMNPVTKVVSSALGRKESKPS